MCYSILCCSFPTLKMVRRVEKLNPYSDDKALSKYTIIYIDIFLLITASRSFAQISPYTQNTSHIMTETFSKFIHLSGGKIVGWSLNVCAYVNVCLHINMFEGRNCVRFLSKSFSKFHFHVDFNSTKCALCTLQSTKITFTCTQHTAHHSMSPVTFSYFILQI